MSEPQPSTAGRSIPRHASTAYRPRHASPDPGDRTRFTPSFAGGTEGSVPRIGAGREGEVARRLATLGPNWRCLSAAELGDRPDHMVIGPAGVFAIATRQHLDASIIVDGDQVNVDGYDQPYVADGRLAAEAMSRWLSARTLSDIDVRALLILGSGGRVDITAQPADGAVRVLTRPDVVRHLWSLPPVLAQPKIDRIYAAARALAAWSVVDRASA